MERLQVELVFDILSRLPVKDLLRFKRVCKSWRALIADPRFVKLQFDRSIESDRLTLIFQNNFHVYYVSDVFKVADDPTKLELHFKGSPLFLEQILGSCNGMICFYTYSYGVFVLNPSTREFKNLPELPGYWRRCYSIVWGFGFCSNSQRFKVVRIVYFKSRRGLNFPESHVIVHTVGSNSWRSITTQVPGHIHSSTQALVNGAPHWSGIRSNSTMKIVYFDVAHEVFGELPYPDNQGDNMKMDFLGELRGCLCVFRAFNHGGHIEIWVMDEYGIKESWNMKFAISHPIVVDNLWSCQPLRFLRNGEILVKCHERVVKYDPSRESVHEIKIPGITLAFVESLLTLKGERIS